MLLSGCTAQITPDSCRYFGVDVAEGTPVTGRIASEQVATLAEVRVKCQSPFGEIYGCSLAIAPDEYAIYAADGYALQHERCHALYEIGHG